jgi:transposase
LQAKSQDMNDTILEVLKFVFPIEVVDFFDITKTENISNTLHVYFEEKNNPPINNLKSNGFYDESEIKDFPLRDKKVVLHLKRRRWLDDVGKSYSNEFQLVAIGTRYSKEFAEFLKKIAQYEADFSRVTRENLSH